MKACLPNTIMFAWESSSDLGLLELELVEMAEIILSVKCRLGTLFLTEVEDDGQFLFFRMLCNLTDVLGNATCSELA
jgi:hypothetical protein